jgi:integrase/recombinase XerD
MIRPSTSSRLRRKHHLDYDQTKYVVEQVRHRLGLAPPATRPRTVERLDRAEVERLVASAYRDDSQHGLLIKTLFLTGARISEFVHIRVEGLRLDDDPPRIHLTHAKGQASRYVPILPALAQELRTHLLGRHRAAWRRMERMDTMDWYIRHAEDRPPSGFKGKRP